VVRPYDPTQNLRLGTHYDPPQVHTYFRFPADRDHFGRVTLRCVGVGECRRAEGGTMCPSYRVMHEEMHSTRGRAHLLFEMLQGSPLGGGWRSEPVREALDLCLACKGCKHDCPVNADMATYKAEFLSHYYEGRPRPRHAYAMGWITWWARLASLAPGLANFVSHAPLLGDLFKWAGNIAPQRRVPAFAPETFKEWFFRRRGAGFQPADLPGRLEACPTGPRNQDKSPVILWADTFTNHFHPDVARAAVDVLEAAGLQVVVPEQSLCCGRPLYDFGMLDTAERLLRQILDTLRPQIQAGIPVVGLEPSCVAVFRDELINLFSDDEDARRLSQQAFLLSEFLTRKVKDYHPPQLKRKAIVHGHCHHRAVMRMDDEEAVLKKLGLDFHVLDSGCCGMALCTKDTGLTDVARMMVENDCGAIPVVGSMNSRKPIGIVTDRGIVTRTLADGKVPFQMAAGDCMTPEVFTVLPDEDVSQCARIMKAHQVRRVLVVDDGGRCIGMVAQADLAEHAPEHETADMVRNVSQPAGAV
jgi:Fe-S oxidoreductase